MKKTLLVALLACLTIMFASCKKEKTLNGTNWKTHTTTTQQVGEGALSLTANITFDGTMSFTDATNGSMTINFSGTAEGMGLSNPIESQNLTRTFTYTFDGEKGTLTGKDHTGAESTLPFTYNKKDNTITISENMVDEETGISLKVVLVFTEVK